MTAKIILVTGASSGVGRLAANALVHSGHTVCASMRDTIGRNAPKVASVEAYAKEQGVDLRPLEPDVSRQDSVDAGVPEIIAAHGRIDVIVHNAGHMAFGPAETFTPEQFAELYDINVLSTQRVNRAALPHMRRQRAGLLVWVSSSSSAGGTPPYLAPYFAAKAGMDALAVQYARELSRWGIETPIIVSRRLHQGNQPLRPCRRADGQGAARRVRGRPLCGFRPADSGCLREHRAGRRRSRCCRGRHRRCSRHAIRRAAVPRAHRSQRGRRRCRLCRDRSRAQRDAAPGRLRRPAEAEPRHRNIAIAIAIAGRCASWSWPTFIPSHAAKKKAKIVFTSSMGGLFTPAGFGIYVSTKHALEAIAEAMQQELQPYGIKV